jgi:hypothetical protein
MGEEVVKNRMGLPAEKEIDEINLDHRALGKVII